VQRNCGRAALSLSSNPKKTRWPSDVIVLDEAWVYLRDETLPRVPSRLVEDAKEVERCRCPCHAKSLGHFLIPQSAMW